MLEKRVQIGTTNAGSKKDLSFQNNPKGSRGLFVKHFSQKIWAFCGGLSKHTLKISEIDIVLDIQLKCKVFIS